jgi:mRNA interferase RelE/StbE
LTTYELEFLEDALKEWAKLGANIQQQFKKKLRERLAHPRVPSAKLHGLADCYKIKLRAAGYRLVYRVDDKRIVVTVVTVGRRDRNLVYKIAAGRLD